jgi:hypothetical protein
MRDLDELEEAWLAYVAGLRFPEQRTRRTPTRVRMLVTLPE